MADAFAKWLERALGDRGLIVYDASDPVSKPLAAEVFARELATAGQTARLAAATGSDLVARGYHAQVQVQDDSLALFRLDGSRLAIRRQDSHLVAGEETYAADALQEEARVRPAAFSPSVLLRPIVQDTLFPTVCYVAGPNELAYLGQLRGVYAHFGVPMPLMYPRATATLLDSASLRFLTKYHLPLEALQPQDEAALNDLLAAQIPPAVEESFADASETIETEMAKLIAGRPDAGPDARRRREIDARTDAARSAGVARQDDPGGQAPRRNPAAAIHPRACAGLSSRSRAGADHRIRVLPEPVRARPSSIAWPTSCRSTSGHHWIVTI